MVEQNLCFFFGVYGLCGWVQNEKIFCMSEVFGLKSIVFYVIDELLLGFKQWLVLVCLLMYELDILFFDELIFGVDFFICCEFWLYINSMVEKGVMVMVIIYFMDEVEYCDCIGLVYCGKLIVSGMLDDLKVQLVNDE